MTSAWNTKSSYNFIASQISPTSFDNTGRASVVSDPGYSSAANSISAEYHENDFSYFDEEFSKQFHYQQEFSQPTMPQPPQYQFNGTHANGGYPEFMQRKTNNSNQGYHDRTKFADYNQRNSMKRNRSTSEIENHHFYAQNSRGFEPLASSAGQQGSYARTYDKHEVDIPTISVDEYLFSNENVFFSDSTSLETPLSSTSYRANREEDGIKNPISINRSTSYNGPQYLGSHTGSIHGGGSRLPSTDSYYEGNTSTASSSPFHQTQFSPSSLDQTNVAQPVQYKSDQKLQTVHNQLQPYQQQTCKNTNDMASSNNQKSNDDLWKGYMEKPLSNTPTIGEESADADLGMLYDYYKVPQEKRFQTCQLLTRDNYQSASGTEYSSATPSAISTSAHGIQSSIVTSSLHKDKGTKGNASYQKPTNHNFSQLLGSTSPSTRQLNHLVPNAVSILRQEEFEYVMEAPKSLKQKEHEPIMSYINKGQFYCITLRRNRQVETGSSKVRSVVQVVFGDGKPEEEQLRHWRYWHARQHTAKQRIIDIADYKESNMIFDVEEIAHNAIAFSWDSKEEAKIYISCNCLSTDFSAQKGIKGLPLLLQVDTYPSERANISKLHRGVCQIKVFCDKGAERKIRDEERKALKKSQKKQHGGLATPTKAYSSTPSSINSKNNSTSSTAPLKRLDNVYFKNVSDLTPSTYFIPAVAAHSISTSSHAGSSPSKPNQENEVFPIHRENNLKRCHSGLDAIGETTSKVSKADVGRSVLLYVRAANEEIYDGLMLPTPDIRGLKAAIEEKYSYPASKITKLLKRCRKGITVNLDDNIIGHYCNEDTFTIAFQTNPSSTSEESYCVTLTEI